MEQSLTKKQRFSTQAIEYDFEYKNILFKGVPGTGKSGVINKIIQNYLNLSKESPNILRINIHADSSCTTTLQGLIQQHIINATFVPYQPFVLILEEIQESNLNELIGELIYLVEPSKRAKGIEADDKEYNYPELIKKIVSSREKIHTIQIPMIAPSSTSNDSMVIPENLYIFATSNYREDKKIIEDNLLRRFEVIELYPRYKEEIGKPFSNQEVSDFLRSLNGSIVKVLREHGQLHPDRFMIGHSTWMKITTPTHFYRIFLKVVTEFKDIKEIPFKIFDLIIKELPFPFETKYQTFKSYEEWIKYLQKEGYEFLNEVW